MLAVRHAKSTPIFAYLDVPSQQTTDSDVHVYSSGCSKASHDARHEQSRNDHCEALKAFVQMQDPIKQ